MVHDLLTPADRPVDEATARDFVHVGNRKVESVERPARRPLPLLDLPAAAQEARVLIDAR
ncbi:hypothetical protein [Streptomyces sp. NBC_00989]|uniref:hypothetical protein n=1 Tax=Streptomyces sp. NBC_00989 TaxID=2903705 RepID=UPI003865BC69|nr:hypothetical protein OG714_03020 [Streptomyces sp. NBC_00989]